ncbi:MAG: trigger factor [Ferruginibacter sp.]
MATVVRENIGLLNDKLTVKIAKEDYVPAFEKSLKSYSKNANIPGFRKGMVPAGMIKKMYGPSIFNDEVLKTVEKELMGYLQTEKPDIFAQPLPLDNDLSKVDLNNPSDIEFGFEIGLKPEYKLPDFSKAKLTLNKVKITDEMVTEELSRMQVKGGKMTEPETIDNEENVLNVTFTESDENGNPVEGGIVKENSLLLKYFSKTLQKQLKGKKQGDHIIFQLAKSFDKDMMDNILHDLGLEKDDAEAAKKYFRLDITKIGFVEKRELNEEFFNEVYPGRSIATEDELRSELKKEIEQYWGSQSRVQLQDQIYHYLLDETEMEFPAEFLKRWLQNGGEKPKTADEAESEYPGFSNSLKWTLISDKLVQDNNLQVGQDELKEFMKADVMRYFGQMQLPEGADTSWIDSYVDRMMKDEKQVDGTYRRLLTDKLFNWAETQVKPKEKEVTSEELQKMQHNHQH